ncbi:MAG: threonine--tRNA ligase [bacterium]
MSKNKEEINVEVLRHSASHVMAYAVKELFGDVKLGIGPAIENGFYYDFEKKEPFTPEDLEKIEKKMRYIVKSGHKFERMEMKKNEARKFLQEQGEKYKLELLEDIADDTVSFYKSGDFIDMCRGPHIASPGKLKYFKLLSIAGAYWKGDEKRQMLQRIYGTAFNTKEELDNYLYVLEEAKKRDHRKIGKDLDLFSIHNEAGAGLVFWHPKGAMIRKVIEDFYKEAHLKKGYQFVHIPHVAKVDLWKTSGHWDFYRENMYSPMDIDDQEYIIKPMNCPGHILMYKNTKHSYRELPIRWAEFGTVYRYEKSGVLHGLMRVRGFTQDDAHIFCRLDQLEDELTKLIDMVLFILRTFGFKDFDVYLSTRPEKFVGTIENWDRAQEALKKALERTKLAYEVDPGEGVFYGPKVDIKIKDCLGRAWQCSTIQVDFNLPERFEVNYTGEDNSEHQAIMIHRALMGSLERFFGVLIEHYAGAFPTWLAPVQALVMTITDKQKDYARGVLDKLLESGLRAEADLRNEKIGFKIREAQLQKIPYMFVIGAREAEKGEVAVRKRTGEDLGAMSIENAAKLVIEEADKKA